MNMANDCPGKHNQTSLIRPLIKRFSMHEFCPLCWKNGVKARIKAFHINLEEAVFVCSSDSCLWPVGHQEVKYIDRPFGKDWSKTWDETTQKHLKIEHDPLHDFWEYTPPQTPGTEVFSKDTASGCMSTPVTVPDIVFNPMSTLLDDNVYTPQEISTSLSKNPCYNNNRSSINNVNKSLKPKVVDTELVNYKLQKLPSKGYVLVDKNRRNNEPCKNTIKLSTIKVNGPMNISTSTLKNIKVIKSDKVSNLSTKIKIRSPAKEGGLKRLTSRSTKPIAYKKFDFNELLKAKSTKVKEECKTDVNNVVNLKEMPQACIEVKSECNGQIKLEVKQELKNEVQQDEIACSLDKIDFDDLLNHKSTNGMSQTNNDVEIVNNVKTNVSPMYETELDFDSILGITSTSKDSGISQDMTDNGDFELQLDDLLAGFSDDISNANIKCNPDDSDEFKWINALFE